MGGGNKRDRPDRSGEYVDREPSDDSVTTAQTRLNAYTESDLTSGEDERAEETTEVSTTTDASTGAVTDEVEGGEAAEDASVGATGAVENGESGAASEESGVEGDTDTVSRVDEVGDETDGTGGEDGDGDVAESESISEDDGEDVDFEAFDDPNEAARHLGPTDERTISVDLGATDPETIEEEFGVDLNETEMVDDIHRSETDHEYPSLDFKQTQNVKDALEEKYGEKVYNDLDDLMGSWKGGSDKDDKQTLELIAKKANGIGRPVRRGGEKAREVDPDDERIDAYRDLSRISRGFVKANLTDDDDDSAITVHRGVRMANEALTAQFIDNPSADAYRLQTSATSNHSTDDGVADVWGNPYKITHDIQPDDVTLAIDHVQVTGMAEGELHIDSDDVTVSADGIGFSHTKHLHGDNETVDDVFDAFSDPETASDGEHRDVRTLIESMRERDEVPRTEEGVHNLIDYFDGVAGNEDVSKQRTEKTRQIVKGTLDGMDTDRTVREDSTTMGAITDPESASPEDHKRATEFISTYSHDGMRDGHTDEDAEQLVEWVNHLADDQPMDDRELRSAHRNVEKVMEEADTDVTVEIDRFDMT